LPKNISVQAHQKGPDARRLKYQEGNEADGRFSSAC